MKVIAYAYGAAKHCPDCTKKDWESDRLQRDANHVHASPGLDDNGLPFDLVDSEGNIIGAEFDDTEVDCPAHCDKCGEFLPLRLTPDGEAYVREQIEFEPEDAVAKIWQEHYSYLFAGKNERGAP